MIGERILRERHFRIRADGRNGCNDIKEGGASHCEHTVLESEWSEAVDDCRQYILMLTCLVSPEYGLKIIEGVLILNMHLCGRCVLYLLYWRGTEDRPRKPCEYILCECG